MNNRTPSLITYAGPEAARLAAAIVKKKAAAEITTPPSKIEKKRSRIRPLAVLQVGLEKALEKVGTSRNY